MPYKRLWIKDLPIQEVSRRLKGGENVYHDQDEGFIAIVDGLMMKWKNGEAVEINPTFRPQNPHLYFLDEELFQLEVGKEYETKSGNKAIITFDSGEMDYPYRGTIIGFPHLCFWNADGKIEIKAGCSAEFDIVGIWKEKGEKENV